MTAVTAMDVPAETLLAYAAEETTRLQAQLTLEHLTEVLSPEALGAVTDRVSLHVCVDSWGVGVHAESCEDVRGVSPETTSLVEVFTIWDHHRLCVHDCLPHGEELRDIWQVARRERASLHEFRTEAADLVRARDELLRTRTVPDLPELLELLEYPSPGTPPTLRELREAVAAVLRDAVSSLSARELMGLFEDFYDRRDRVVVPRGSGRGHAGPLAALVVSGAAATLLRLWAGGTTHAESTLLLLAEGDAELLRAELLRLEHSCCPQATVPSVSDSWDWVGSAAAQRLILQAYLEATEAAPWSAEEDCAALASSVQLAAEVFTL